ncbi:Tannase/feruloyl esterase [Rhexocercosporidium sp. MPI-PUGE-AT-0058]|nr:Tannase/feruloyl esterase [Rhexocercosporidium sp. MPI-PUGE-AT-0058]
MALQSVSPSLCSPQTFTTPTIFSAEFLGVTASLVSNYSADVLQEFNVNGGPISVRNASFCNVTVTYTHPGRNDSINVEAWLPMDTYNGRLQAVGGGALSAGRFLVSYNQMAGAVGEGYATVSTDAGLFGTPADWAQVSPGNVNQYLLQNLMSVSLNEQAIIGKSVVQSFYGQPPQFSYFSGCSQGGRQALMLAQRYPDAYDGIAASAPAINWNPLLSSFYWPQLFMNLAGQAPEPCELTAITQAAIAACDADDGVVDGLISDVESCKFDPFSVVDTSFNCSGITKQISQIAAMVANATWAGPQSPDGTSLWFGVNRGSLLSGDSRTVALATTDCSANGTCVGVPADLGPNWLSFFLNKNPKLDLKNMTQQEYTRLFLAGNDEYAHIATNNPDLSAFFERGGKMIGFHGLADPAIPVGGSTQYFDSVTSLIPDVHDHYRLFEVPGLGHCAGGPGGHPTTIFNALRAWVENGTVPETLPVSFSDQKGTINKRGLCPYPQKQRYDGSGDPTSAKSFTCSV